MPDAYTVEDYFRIDTDSEIRHEYIDGDIIDMAGGTDRHSQVITNIIGSFWSWLRDKPCQVRESNFRVRYGCRVQYGYPDALIVCGPPQFDPKGPRESTLLNPRVIFEVLSESTEAYDRGLKFERYREIESLAEYALISTDRPSVDVYRRQNSGFWLLQPYSGVQAIAAIESAGIDLPLADLYEGIAFEPEPADEPATQPRS